MGRSLNSATLRALLLGHGKAHFAGNGMPFTSDATPQMTASRRARREARKCPNPALQSLLREGPLTADRALSWGICGPLICAIHTLHHTSYRLKAVCRKLKFRHTPNLGAVLQLLT
ncbi:MAG: hypothetical protein PVI97_11535 [Candidatus Thiodiazotropha sp.]